eukprot:g2173.t1
MSYHQVVQGEPLERSGRFNGEGGVRKEWWWEAGPVDSCCFCCSLRAGVAILATIDLLYKGVWTTFYETQQMENTAANALSQLEPLYEQRCTGAMAQTDDCLQAAHMIELLKDEIQIFDHLPAAFYVQGGIAIIAGIAGLLAVFNADALAAKVYLWTWLPRFVAMVVTEWCLYAKMKEVGLNPNLAFNIFWQIVECLFVVYFVKVLWSYQNRLIDGSSESSSPRPPPEGIQLRNGIDGV